jgi:hypothetical protein
MRDGRVIGQGTGAELRANAGTTDLEAAFLVLSGLDAEGNPVRSEGGVA